MSSTDGVLAATYTLVLRIEPRTAANLGTAGSRVVVAKQGTTAAATVAWLVFEPRPRTIVRWQEAYGLYAVRDGLPMPAAFRDAAAIDRAVERCLHPLLENGFGTPVFVERIPPRHYDLQNETLYKIACGLLQCALVDGELIRSPINMTSIPPGYCGNFTRLTTVRAWIAEPLDRGIVVVVPADAVAISCDGDGAYRRELLYNAETARFVASIDRRNSDDSNDN